MIRRQRGVALITVMLIVAVATILAVQMANDQDLAVNRAASIFDSVQARQYAYGGEELARQIIQESLKKNPAVVSMDQDWASDKLQYDYDQGHIELSIEDLQGRLNLNSLLLTGPAGVAARQRFNNLFNRLGVDPAFTNRITDWIDANQARLPGGAEDYEYLGLDQPYRAANRPMEDPSALRLILDMDDKSFAKIAPYVCALPDPSAATNVNTAPAVVLQAIAPSLSDADAEAIVKARKSGTGYQTPQAFFAAIANVYQGSKNMTLLGVQSDFFQVDVRARYGKRFAYLTSIIQRDPTNGAMRVIYRNLSRKIYPVVSN